MDSVASLSVPLATPIWKTGRFAVHGMPCTFNVSGPLGTLAAFFAVFPWRGTAAIHDSPCRWMNRCRCAFIVSKTVMLYIRTMPNSRCQASVPLRFPTYVRVLSFVHRAVAYTEQQIVLRMPNTVRLLVDQHGHLRLMPWRSQNSSHRRIAGTRAPAQNPFSGAIWFA